MAAILLISSAVRNSTSTDIFDANTDGAQQHKEYSDEDDDNDRSRLVTSTPHNAGRYKIATTTPKTIKLFNQSADIKVGNFRNFEFVDSQRAHCETFVNDLMIFLDNPTKQ